MSEELSIRKLSEKEIDIFTNIKASAYADDRLKVTFDDIEKPSKKKKKKSNKKDKNKKLSSEKKPKKKKKEKYQGLEEGTEHKMDSKFAKKVLKSIKSKSLRESFEHDKVLIDNRKFWTKD